MPSTVPAEAPPLSFSTFCSLCLHLLSSLLGTTWNSWDFSESVLAVCQQLEALTGSCEQQALPFLSSESVPTCGRMGRGRALHFHSGSGPDHALAPCTTPHPVPFRLRRLPLSCHTLRSSWFSLQNEQLVSVHPLPCTSFRTEDAILPILSQARTLLRLPKVPSRVPAATRHLKAKSPRSWPTNIPASWVPPLTCCPVLLFSSWDVLQQQLGFRMSMAKRT